MVFSGAFCINMTNPIRQTNDMKSFITAMQMKLKLCIVSIDLCVYIYICKLKGILQVRHYLMSMVR